MAMDNNSYLGYKGKGGQANDI